MISCCGKTLCGYRLHVQENNQFVTYNTVQLLTGICGLGDVAAREPSTRAYSRSLREIVAG